MYFVNQTIINGVDVDGGDGCLSSLAGWLVGWSSGTMNLSEKRSCWNSWKLI
jgi:hypothetical protein